MGKSERPNTRETTEPSAVWTWQHTAEEQRENAETGNETAAGSFHEESHKGRGTASGTVHGSWHRATEPHGEVRRRRMWDHRKPAGKTEREPWHRATEPYGKSAVGGCGTTGNQQGTPRGTRVHRAPRMAPRHGTWHRCHESNWGEPPVADRRPPKHQWVTRGGGGIRGLRDLSLRLTEMKDAGPCEQPVQS